MTYHAVAAATEEFCVIGVRIVEWREFLLVSCNFSVSLRRTEEASSSGEGIRHISRPNCRIDLASVPLQIRRAEIKGLSMTRIDSKFASLRESEKKAFVAYVMAGDPDYETSLEIVQGLPNAGVDIIELGIPFTDPMADGPTIQLAGQRALEGGQTLQMTLDLAAEFRRNDDTTPIVMMGYYNPIYSHGVERFLDDAVKAGVDGLIIVDLPPEEDDELCIPAQNAGLNFIRLATPTTDDRRLPAVLRNTSGFVYYVSITGITGAAEAVTGDVEPEVSRIKAMTDLPVVVGFGIKTPGAARAIASVSDGAVVGSAIVSKVGDGESPTDVLAFVKSLADGAHAA